MRACSTALTRPPDRVNSTTYRIVGRPSGPWAVLVDPGRSATIRLVTFGPVAFSRVTVVSFAGQGSGSAVVGGGLIAVWAVLGAGRPAGQLGVPSLTEHPAKQGANQHGGKRADSGQGADVAPLGTGGGNSQATQVAADGAGVGLGSGDDRDEGHDDQGEDKDGKAVDQPGPAGHPAGHIAAEQIGQQQDHGRDDGTAHPQLGPVVGAQVGIEADRGGGRRGQGGQHGEGAVGDQHPGEHANEGQLADAGLASQRGPVTSGLDSVRGAHGTSSTQKREVATTLAPQRRNRQAWPSSRSVARPTGYGRRSSRTSVSPSSTSICSLRTSSPTWRSSVTVSVSRRTHSRGTTSLSTTGRSSCRTTSCSDSVSLGPLVAASRLASVIGSRSTRTSSRCTGTVTCWVSVTTDLRSRARPRSRVSVPTRSSSSERVMASSVVGPEVSRPTVSRSSGSVYPAVVPVSYPVPYSRP